MLLHDLTSRRCLIKCLKENHNHNQVPKTSPRISLSFIHVNAFQSIASATVATAAVVVVLSAAATPQQSEETLSNIPQSLSSVCTPGEKDCRKRYKIQRPISKKAEKCTSKCAGTCLLGGFGAPGEGPFNIRRPLVVFKDGFRSRKYCLSECSDICNLIGDGDDGP